MAFAAMAATDVLSTTRNTQEGSQLMKRKSLIVLLSLGVLALASVGGVMIATADSKSGKEGIQERAAEILGVEPSELKDALSQARREAVDARIEELIDSAVTDGDITESEATEIRDWLAARPELSAINGTRGKFGLMWLHSGANEKAEAILEKLVEAGKITDDEVTAYTEWIEERPDAVDQLLPTPNKGERGRFKQHGRGKGRNGCGADIDGQGHDSASWDKNNKST